MLNPKSQRAKTLHSTADIFFEGQVIGSEKKCESQKETLNGQHVPSPGCIEFVALRTASKKLVICCLSPKRALPVAGWLRTRKSDTFQENWSKSWKPDMFHVKEEIRGELIWLQYSEHMADLSILVGIFSRAILKIPCNCWPTSCFTRCVPVFLNPSASHAAARGLKWVLTCEKKNTRLTRHMVSLFVRASRNSIYKKYISTHM